ncbi:hypothetical protein BKA70DRAFT_1306514, partial [Coprinopsis sp. MPI-PUGE-AT-0042]
GETLRGGEFGQGLLQLSARRDWVVHRLSGSVNAERQEAACHGWLAKRSALLTEGLPVSGIGIEKELQVGKTTASASSKTRELVRPVQCSLVSHHCIRAGYTLLLCRRGMARTVYTLNEALLLIDWMLSATRTPYDRHRDQHAKPNLRWVSKYLSSPTSTLLSHNWRLILACFGAEDLDDQISIATEEGATMNLRKRKGGARS